MDPSFITRIVEAALMAANQPLSLAQLHSLFPEDQPAPNGSVEQALETLREGCADRGVELVELASGFRFQVKADVHPWVARLWTERKTKYTRATLETLALIAYRQPITRGEIEQVRGVAVSSNIIQSLEEREWIRVVGHRDVPGKPALYGTTKAFLDYFGLKRLDELPPLSELRDIGELEPQLKFDEGGEAAGGKPVAPADAGGAALPDNPADGSAAGMDDGDDLGASETEDDRIEGMGEANAAPAAEGQQADEQEFDEDRYEDTDAGETGLDHHPASNGEPDTAPGERAEDENAFLAATGDPDDAVETTTVPMIDDDAAPLAEAQASSEQEKND